MTIMAVSKAVTALAALVAAVGCAHQDAPTAVRPSTAAWAPITLHEADNGRTVRARVGQRVVFELGSPTEAGSTYWTFDPLRGLVLAQVGGQSVQGFPPGTGPCAYPGMGCGTVTITADVAGAGATTVVARRGTCGEVLPCTPDASLFSVTIDATA